MSATGLREEALDVLLQVLEEGKYCHKAMNASLERLRQLSDQERHFFTRLCEGTVEKCLTIDYVLAHFSSVKLDKMKPVIRNILRLGIYQLLFMDSVPDSAACNESVKLAGKRGFRGLQGYVNGVLRSVARNPNFLKESIEGLPYAERLSLKHSVPAWIADRLVSRYGSEKTDRILEGTGTELPLSIRCSRTRISTEELVMRLTAEGAQAAPGYYSRDALRISGYGSLQMLTSFKEGLFQVQDESSMLVCDVAAPKPGDFILDVCAAPGGKSLHLADRLAYLEAAGMGDVQKDKFLTQAGMVEARDISEAKLKLIRQNVERLGYGNIRVKLWDALVFDEKLEAKADIVIADLPCSGLGIIGKKPDIRYRMTPDEVLGLSRLQRQMLDVVTRYVKPGGTLIYSTCTVSREENDENAAYIEGLGFEPESLEPYLPEVLKADTGSTGRLQLLPGIHKSDGFFISRFRRV